MIVGSSPIESNPGSVSGAEQPSPAMLGETEISGDWRAALPQILGLNKNNGSQSDGVAEGSQCKDKRENVAQLRWGGWPSL